MSIKNVVVIGAGGNLGPSILEGLEGAGHFNITIVSRKSSTSKFPTQFKVVSIEDDYPLPELLEAFKGQDAVVSTISPRIVATQIRIIDAAIKAGVQRFIPAEFSSDTANQRGSELVPIFIAKTRIRQYLMENESSGLTWTGLATGPFTDYGIKNGLLGFDLKANSAIIYDGGKRVFSTTSRSKIGIAVAKILQLPEITANKFLFVESLATTQNEILSALEKASNKIWEIKSTTIEQTVEVAREKLSKGDLSGIVPLIVAATYSAGTGSNFSTECSGVYANNLLGLGTENLEELVATLV